MEVVKKNVIRKVFYASTLGEVLDWIDKNLGEDSPNSNFCELKIEQDVTYSFESGTTWDFTITVDFGWGSNFEFKEVK